MSRSLVPLKISRSMTNCILSAGREQIHDQFKSRLSVLSGDQKSYDQFVAGIIQVPGFWIMSDMSRSTAIVIILITTTIRYQHTLHHHSSLWRDAKPSSESILNIALSVYPISVQNYSTSMPYLFSITYEKYRHTFMKWLYQWFNNVPKWHHRQNIFIARNDQLYLPLLVE